MKLICLNTWGGKLYNPLINFIKKHSKDTDFFCFQEVFKTSSNVKLREERRINLYYELSKVLINHKGHFVPVLYNYILFSSYKVIHTSFNLSHGLSIFVKKDLIIDSAGDFFVYGDGNSFNPKNLNTIPRKLQYITFTNGVKKFTICNLHGIWLKEDKGDSSSRLEQSKKIQQFLDKQKGEKILCGDFNLNINTKSIKILEEDMKNLIKEYKIPTTRNKYFPGDEKFADYVFVSPGVKVTSFMVPDIEVSDHLPLILKFN
jgi:exonuclease III